MPKTIDPDIAPTSKFSLNESYVLTDVQPERLARLIKEQTVPAKASSTTKGVTMFSAVELSVVKFIFIWSDSPSETEVTKKATNDFLRYARSNWQTLIMNPSNAPEFHSEELVLRARVRKKGIEKLFKDLARAYTKLRDAKSRVVEDQDIRAGLPTIQGTRIGVYEIADIVKADGKRACLEAMPTLRPEDVDAAELYAKAFPRPQNSEQESEVSKLIKAGKLRLISETSVPIPSNS